MEEKTFGEYDPVYNDISMQIATNTTLYRNGMYLLTKPKYIRHIKKTYIKEFNEIYHYVLYTDAKDKIIYYTMCPTEKKDTPLIGDVKKINFKIK